MLAQLHTLAVAHDGVHDTVLALVGIILALAFAGDEPVEHGFPWVNGLDDARCGFVSKGVGEALFLKLVEGDVTFGFVAQECGLRLEIVFVELVACKDGGQQAAQTLLQHKLAVGYLFGVDEFREQFHIDALQGMREGVGQQHSGSHAIKSLLASIVDKSAQCLLRLAFRLARPHGEYPIENRHAVAEECFGSLVLPGTCIKRFGKHFQCQIALALCHRVHAFQQEVGIGHPNACRGKIFAATDIVVVVDQSLHLAYVGIGGIELSQAYLTAHDFFRIHEIFLHPFACDGTDEGGEVNIANHCDQRLKTAVVNQTDEVGWERAVEHHRLGTLAGSQEAHRTLQFVESGITC